VHRSRGSRPSGAALDGADIAADGDGAWLDQSIVDRLRLGLECRPEAGELPDDGE
jgi:hypothetical protein